MDPDATLAEFWVAMGRRHEAIVNGDREGEFVADDDAVEAAHNLFNWLADGGFAPDWTKGPS